jgi:hypothetical protein
MKKLILISAALTVALVLGGCTNADIAQLTALGSPASITCYSGGKIIYQGMSTGKIATEQQSDGWYFEDASTHELVRVSGQCVIKQK